MNEIVVLKRLKRTIEVMRGLNPHTLLIPTTKDLVKNNLKCLKKLLCDEGDEITTLTKCVEGAFN